MSALLFFSFVGLRLIAGLYYRRFTNHYLLSNLSKVAKNTLIALFPLMTAEENPKKVKRSLIEINHYLKTLSFRTKLELELALVFFNQATLLTGNFKPFPYMTLEKKLEYLNYLASGPRFFGPIFLGLKEVCFLGHYALEENARSIPGYETMVPKDGDADPEFNRQYERLEAR